MEENTKSGSGRGKGILFLILILIILLLIGGVFFFRDKLPFLSGDEEVELEESLVLEVIDARTIEVLYKGNEEVVSIVGIDVPNYGWEDESEECFGEEVFNKANELLGGENVVLETDETRNDKGRLLGYIRLLSGEDYGEKLLWGGYAWNSDDHERGEFYGEAENFAEDNGLGLWSAETCNGKKTVLVKTVAQEVETMPEELIEIEEEEILIEPEEEVEVGYDCVKGKYTCEYFYSGTGTTAMAQAVFDFCKNQKAGDLYHLDKDKNGIACDDSDNEIITDSVADAAIKQMVKLPSSGMEMAYDCSYDRYSCEDFSNSIDAQVMFEICKARGVGDIHKLDSDKDEKACEYLGE